MTKMTLYIAITVLDTISETYELNVIALVEFLRLKLQLCRDMK